jgi:hypothetical protein
MATGFMTYCSNEQSADEIVDWLPPKARFNPLLQPVVDSYGRLTQDHIFAGVGIMVVFPEPSDS